MLFGSKTDPATRLLTQPMAVVERGVYRGPHYYSHTPMVRIMLDLGRMEDWPTDQLPGFAEALLECLPGLEQHGCCFGTKGGFRRRLEEGTWLGHVVEHAALELQTLAGNRVTRGKTRSVRNRAGVYNVMFAYEHEELGLAAGRIAIELIDSLLPEGLRGVTGLDAVWPLEGEFDLEERLAWLRRLAGRKAFGPSTQALVAEAKRRGIPVTRLDEHSFVRLGHGKYQQRLRASITGRTPLVAADLASDKALTKTLLHDAGVPVPRGAVVRTAQEAETAAESLRHPLVVKPLDGNHGRGVTTGIADAEQLRHAFDRAAPHSRRVIVEEHFPGRDYRILIVANKLVAVSERVPAHIVGDGRQTVAQLVDAVNRDPRRGIGHERAMTRIALDEAAAEFLGRSGRTVDSVPGAGEVVFLCAAANLSTGGTAVDRTNEIHPDNAEIARRAAMVVGLDVAGIDFIAPDIARSVRETGGGVIEVNASPGLRMHLEPSEGPPRDVARPIVEMLFPKGAPSRVPIIAVTGTNGKSTVARMVKQILRYTGCTVGLTTTSGVYIDDVLISPGDATGPRSARMVLGDPTVEVAVLETARGGLLREGLAFDEADVGAVLNVAPDHLGLKGIETVEDLADVKSLVVETVRRGGTSILNADDPLVARMERRAGGRIAWFSLHGGADMPDFLRRHIDEGGLALVREPGPEGGTLVFYHEGCREQLMRAGDIPATLHGMAGFNIANALAAAAICLAHGVPALTVRSALGGFQSSFDQNPGRLNVCDAHGFRVIVDYAHNPAGLTALGEVVTGLSHRYRRRLAALSIAGDRRDEDIIEMGRIAAGLFDQLYFREDTDLRGRAPGEIMTLLRQGAFAAGALPEQVHLITCEHAAANACLEAAEPGDLVVITPTRVEAVWRQVQNFRKGPAFVQPVTLVAAG